MPAEIGGRSTAAAAFLTVFNFLLGVFCIFAGVLLMENNTSAVRTALTNASNLPVGSEVITNGLTPLVIVSPQAIVLPAIIGMIAACSRKRCGYVAYLIFAILSSLWIPIQTAAALLFACCYALVYAVHRQSIDNDVSTNLLNMFFCLIGLFGASLISWVLTIIGSILSCCNTCCYEYVRPRHEDEVPLLMSVDSAGLFRAGLPLDAPGRPVVEARFSPGGPYRDGQGYTMLMTASAPPMAWQQQHDMRQTSAPPPPPASEAAPPARAAPPAAQPPPQLPPQELAATGDYERQQQLDAVRWRSAARHGMASGTAEAQHLLLDDGVYDPRNSASEVSLMKFED